MTNAATVVTGILNKSVGFARKSLKAGSDAKGIRAYVYAELMTGGIEAEMANMFAAAARRVVMGNESMDTAVNYLCNRWGI